MTFDLVEIAISTGSKVILRALAKEGEPGKEATKRLGTKLLQSTAQVPRENLIMVHLVYISKCQTSCAYFLWMRANKLKTAVQRLLACQWPL